MSRSIRIAPKFTEIVKLAVKRHGFLSQRALASSVGLARSTVSNFLGGKRVDYATFIDICQNLDLNWQEIVHIEEENGKGVDLVSEFYVERPPVEERCYEAIAKPGALLRIKAPQNFGKSCLITKILARAEQLGCETLTLSFDLADRAILTDLEKFSQWLCVAVSKKMKRANRLAEYWEDMLACNYNTTAYFQNYLLTDLPWPLLIVLDRVDLVFERPEISIDFCKLLRNWHDRARRGESTSETWQKLRLTIAHATEVYGSLDINSSPLAGVGVVVELPEFNPQQVRHLAGRRGLTWDAGTAEKLMCLVGGHPYLVQLAVNYIKEKDENNEKDEKEATLDRLLLEAATEAGIYHNHLGQHLKQLERYEELTAAFAEVVKSNEAVLLKPEQAFKLQSMGLVTLKGNLARPRCDLYRQYFRDRL